MAKAILPKIGESFGNLIVLGVPFYARFGIGRRRYHIVVECQCKKVIVAYCTKLMAGETVSCGFCVPTDLPKIAGIEFRYLPRAIGYCAGSNGTVWTYKRGNTTVPWYQMAATVEKGYARLSVTVDGKLQKATTGRFVCEAFHGSCPDGKEACHQDGNSSNDTPENLYWGTREQNMQDAIRHGTLKCLQRGEKAPHAKLDSAAVTAIRQSTKSSDNLAAEYRVSVEYLRKVRYRRCRNEVA